MDCNIITQILVKSLHKSKIHASFSYFKDTIAFFVLIRICVLVLYV